MRISLLCIVMLFVLAVGQTVFYYGQLPPTMASHFDGAGQVNGFQSKAAFFGIYWFVMVLSIGTFVPMGFLLRLIPVQFINLPHKDYWLAPETPERRAESINYLVGHMEGMAAATLALLLVVFQMTICTNLNGSSVLPLAPTWLALGSYFVFVFVWMTKLLLRFRKPV